MVTMLIYAAYTKAEVKILILQYMQDQLRRLFISKSQYNTARAKLKPQKLHKKIPNNPIHERSATKIRRHEPKNTALPKFQKFRWPIN